MKQYKNERGRSVLSKGLISNGNVDGSQKASKGLEWTTYHHMVQVVQINCSPSEGQNFSWNS